MAICTGLAVANNYYAQPLLPAIAASMGTSSRVAGLVVTTSQVGYAIGLVTLLPLGDLVERRRLVSVLSAVTGVVLLGMGTATNVAWLLAAALLVGTASVVAQALVPYAASLAPGHERGRVLGMVMSGLLIGILLARTVSGWLAETGTWRAVYFVAGAAMLGEAALLRWRLPCYREQTELGYSRLLASVAALVRDEPVLRLRSTFGFFSFGCFSVVWTSIAFLLSRNYHYSSGVIGMFGLVGAVGATAATLAGRLSDRGWVWRNTGFCCLLMWVSWAALWAGSRSIGWLVTGLVLFDFAAQGLQVTNQSEVYRLRPEARSRLTSAYMLFYFLGGAAGSVLSATLYASLGWDGACLAGGCFATADLALWVLSSLLPIPGGRAARLAG